MHTSHVSDDSRSVMPVYAQQQLTHGQQMEYLEVMIWLTLALLHHCKNLYTILVIIAVTV